MKSNLLILMIANASNLSDSGGKWNMVMKHNQLL